MSVVKKCLEFSGLYEAELLVELMLRYWKHPLAANVEFRNEILEGAGSVLRSCEAGEQQVIEALPAESMSFVAAAWYVEWTSLSHGAEDPDGGRKAWLEAVKQSVPSCFCPPNSLS
jgi:hypothetical protein